MAATIRAFTIFRDEAEAPVADNKDVHHETTTIAVPTSGPLLVYAPDKENVDPTSGSRALSEHLLGKKRKTTLAAKAQPASPTKKPRPLAEKPTKKPSSKSRSTDKKNKRSGLSKRSTSSRTRREPSLPRLTEEGEEHEVLDQVLIDAKCKELTVLPLADISEAYEQAPSPTDIIEAAVQAAEEKAAVAAVSEDKIERSATPPPPSKDVNPSSPVSGSVLSTPERKTVYSAFTFSSPSPASKRLASVRASSVERFSDVLA
ncbi:hypothetical protein C8Q74DRAFT_1372108 [Fomes fomentarius]|nr:hypothetical protein C8Q74DRAFT_1372108 [Fomes fomentarius]